MSSGKYPEHWKGIDWYQLAKEHKFYDDEWDFVPDKVERKIGIKAFTFLSILEGERNPSSGPVFNKLVKYFKFDPCHLSAVMQWRQQMYDEYWAHAEEDPEYVPGGMISYKDDKGVTQLDWVNSWHGQCLPSDGSEEDDKDIDWDIPDL